MHTLAMAVTLFMAGMELDFGEIKGRPLWLGIAGWGISVVLGIAVVGIFHVIPAVERSHDGHACLVHHRPRHADPDLSRQRSARDQVRATDDSGGNDW